jgi:integrase
MNYSFKVLLRSSLGNQNKNYLILRIYVERKKADVALGYKIPLENWSIEKEKAIWNKLGSLSKQQIAEINDVIEAKRAIIHQVFSYARHNKIEYSLSELSQIVSGKSSFEDFYSWARNEIKEQKGMKSKEILNQYLLVINRLEEIQPTLTFSDINLKLVESFDRYLKLKCKLSINTRWRHHKDFKSIINLSIKRGKKTPNPYKDFKPIKAQTERTYLLDSELLILENLYKESNPDEYFYDALRAFLFSCHTGLRHSDLLKIRYEDIIGNELIIHPQKTQRYGKILRIPLSKLAQNIAKETDRGPLFKIPAGQNYNEQLQHIAHFMSIRKKISSHVGRHTFATIFLERGGSVEVLKELMGHSKIETTLIYVHLSNKRKQEQISLMDR